VSATLTDLSAVPAEAMSMAELCRHRRELLATLRLVDHWHRLVSARLDLAVAAVADIEEPVPGATALLRVIPDGLRDLLGIPRCEQRLGETAILLQLRDALRDLEQRADALRARADDAVAAINERLERDPSAAPCPRELELEASAG
jgi:hypothetical protein